MKEQDTVISSPASAARDPLRRKDAGRSGTERRDSSLFCPFLRGGEARRAFRMHGHPLPR